VEEASFSYSIKALYSISDELYTFGSYTNSGNTHFLTTRVNRLTLATTVIKLSPPAGNTASSIFFAHEINNKFNVGLVGKTSSGVFFID